MANPSATNPSPLPSSPSPNDLKTFLTTKQAFNFDPKLGTLLAAPHPTLAEINSLMHDPTFPPASNPSFATLTPEGRRKQMSAWADGLPGARRMARELEREKQKEREREREGEKGDKNVQGLVGGQRFNFGYDMGDFNLVNESEIPENHSASDSSCDQSPRPTTHPTMDKNSSSNNNFYNIPPYLRRYRLQGRPSPYPDGASSDKKEQVMTKLWLEQNPTLVFRLPSPQAGEEDDDDDNEHADNPIQVRRIAPLEGGNAHAPAANRTPVWHVPSPGNDDDNAAHMDAPVRMQRVAAMEDEDAHAPPVANPARVWRVPSPSADDDDDDDDDDGDDDDDNGNENGG